MLAMTAMLSLCLLAWCAWGVVASPDLPDDVAELSESDPELSASSSDFDRFLSLLTSIAFLFEGKVSRKLLYFV